MNSERLKALMVKHLDLTGDGDLTVADLAAAKQKALAEAELIDARVQNAGKIHPWLLVAVGFVAGALPWTLVGVFLTSRLFR